MFKFLDCKFLSDCLCTLKSKNLKNLKNLKKPKKPKKPKNFFQKT